jgi:hypothetical protein
MAQCLNCGPEKWDPLQIIPYTQGLPKDEPMQSAVGLRNMNSFKVQRFKEFSCRLRFQSINTFFHHLLANGAIDKEILTIVKLDRRSETKKPATIKYYMYSSLQ